MSCGIADQLVLLVRDNAVADGMDDICRAADGRARTANHSTVIDLASRQRCTPRSSPQVFLPCFGPLYRWG
jgi:hypothetical protein